MNEQLLPSPLVFDPLAHDSNRAYLKGACVYVMVNNRPTVAYVCNENVPEGQDIPITNNKYWRLFATGPRPDKNKNYLVGCAAIIVNDKNEFLIGRRVDMDGEEVWALFGGKPEATESLAEGCAREVTEEVNVRVEPYRYLYINMKEAMASKTQRTVTAYFLVKLSEFEVSCVENVESEKCFELKWATFEELCELNLWQSSIEECKAAHTILMRQ